MTAEEQEQRILYTNVLEYEQDHVSLWVITKNMSKQIKDTKDKLPKLKIMHLPKYSIGDVN